MPLIPITTPAMNVRVSPSSLSDLTHHLRRVRMIVLILHRADGRFDGQFPYD
jgi:hypothetical protein